ncbi:MAG: NAD(P)/FAD-dependent oxidoreductase [Solirubrobacteraceae bacterium]
MIATTPLWQDERYEGRPPLDGDRTCDVCVIGAGIGGIALARRLAAAGVDVLVLEAGVIGAGATGRNGGFFIAGAAPMYDRSVAAFGHARARRIHAATLTAQDEMLQVADEIGADGHFRVPGLLRLGVDAAEAQAVRAHFAALDHDGFPAVLLEEDDLPAVLRRPGRAALLTPHDGSVHPVRWVRALAGGLAVCEHTRVLEPPAADVGGAEVRTDRGTVRCDRVVVAADGALATLIPQAAAVRPRRLQMLATAPVAPGLLTRPVYAREGHEYAQQFADGRVTLGGFSDVDAQASWTSEQTISEPVQARLERWLREELGLDAPQITHRWAGVVGYAELALPRVGPAPGSGERIWGMGGYNGTGHVQGWVAARIVAERLLSGRSADADLYAALDS